MKTYVVTVPMAGHLVIEVEAESEEAAIDAALESEDLTLDRLEDWQAMRQFNTGNICYCPQPWEAHVETVFDDPAEQNDDRTNGRPESVG